MSRKNFVLTPFLIQIFFCFLMMHLQNVRPAVLDEPREKWFFQLLIVGQTCALAFGSVSIFHIGFTGAAGLELFSATVKFYACFSFINYWWHRARHSSAILWNWLHAAHHSPRRMTFFVAWFRNPAEYCADVFVITLVALLTGVPAEAVVWGMCIEGALEIMHHSNVKTPKSIRWIGYLVQLPEMHRVHHQKGSHKGNYATAIWDWPFGTLVFDWEPVRVGLDGGLLSHYSRSNSAVTGLTVTDRVAHNKGRSRMDSEYEHSPIRKKENV